MYVSGCIDSVLLAGLMDSTTYLLVYLEQIHRLQTLHVHLLDLPKSYVNMESPFCLFVLHLSSLSFQRLAFAVVNGKECYWKNIIMRQLMCPMQM